MEYREKDSETEQIRDISFCINGEDITFKWKWPEGIDYAYVYKTNGIRPVLYEEVTGENARLYTKEEYKKRNGYHEKVKTIDLFTYAIFPGAYEGGKKLLIVQDGKNNQIVVATGKTNIYYSIVTRRNMISRLFSKRKVIQLKIKTDVPVSREALCYVVKSGSYPTNRDDGRFFPFPQDFPPGNNALPEIEIKDNEFIRIFLTDSVKFSEIFNLVRE
ncbi:MAG: hypothetical protein ABFD25_03180 [Clostridiaceae bacterium]